MVGSRGQNRRGRPRYRSVIPDHLRAYDGFSPEAVIFFGTCPGSTLPSCAQLTKDILDSRSRFDPTPCLGLPVEDLHSSHNEVIHQKLAVEAPL